MIPQVVLQDAVSLDGGVTGSMPEFDEHFSPTAYPLYSSACFSRRSRGRSRGTALTSVYR